MSPMGTRHAACIARLTQLFYRKFGDLILLGVQNPIRLNNNSQPEPDLSLQIPFKCFWIMLAPLSYNMPPILSHFANFLSAPLK